MRRRARTTTNKRQRGVADSDSDPSEGATNSFAEMWAGMDDAKKEAVAALCTKESTALKAPRADVPPAFPTLPIGMKCYIDEAAATAALSTVPGLQYKHCAPLHETELGLRRSFSRVLCAVCPV